MGHDGLNLTGEEAMEVAGQQEILYAEKKAEGAVREAARASKRDDKQRAEFEESRRPNKTSDGR